MSRPGDSRRLDASSTKCDGPSTAPRARPTGCLHFPAVKPCSPNGSKPEQLIGGVREFLQRAIGPEIQLRLELGGGKWDVICDAHQLEGALVNLAINARDAMPDGGELTISASERELTASDLSDQKQANPGDDVEIVVSDSGVGMAPDVLSRAVEPFFTTKAARPGNGPGTVASLRLCPPVGRLSAHGQRARPRNASSTFTCPALSGRKAHPGVGPSPPPNWRCRLLRTARFSRR